jgi:hypothetical protein
MTAHNPYSPPTAELRDAGPSRLLAERPRQVAYSTALLTTSLVLSVPMVHWESRRNAQTWILELAVLAFLLVFATVIIRSIWQGRNWARMLYTVVTVLGILALPFQDTNDSVLDVAPSTAEVAMDVVGWALDVPVFYLLFTKPGSLWFRHAREHDSVPQ